MANSLLDLAGFRAKYPEFSTAEDGLVTLFLADAAERLDARTWGSYLDKGHGCLTAHLLAMSPNGQFARLQSDKAETIYNAEFKRLESSVASCIRCF